MNSALERPERLERASPVSLTLVGTSFKTSSLAFREALAKRISRERRLPGMFEAKEYAQLVTCNRIEVVIASGSPSGKDSLVSWVSETPGMKPGAVYVYEGFDALVHLFRVASGLDSMVLGEEQILSQVKEAGIAARKTRASRGVLSALFDASVSAGRRVRVALGETDESVSSMAIRYALERLPAPPRNVLLIGTGKTTRLAANELAAAKLYVATRRSSLPSFSRASLVSHKDLKRVANRCELIISATKHRGYLLKEGDLDNSRHRVVLDLAFPRNVDPRLAGSHTEVYNLEDLARLSAPRRQTSRGSKRAEEMIMAEAESFSRWLLASRQSSTIAQVYSWAEATRREETAAALRRLPELSERERSVIEAMSKRLLSKLLAPPTSFAKSSSPELPQAQRLQLLQRIFEQVDKQ